ncbi:capsular associated protein [Linnemannia hyalina]|uniref:Capsular associated protein n=1 Tax=Linnemannia hyalina TaxID=64524 RepID=A0A9P8BSD1_9FUNG|nr:capsular associated protein [Linnemannia hyalina]
MSQGQRQLVGMMVFIWFVCLWVGLKMMEAAQYSNRSPLLPTTNALLDTPDLYHSLTVPLLNLVNRTKLISTRCGATTLEPHLLSFLTNDLVGSPLSTTSTTTTSSNNDDTLANTTTTTTTTEQSAAAGALIKRTRPYRYLFALVLQDSETILPDVLTRTLETISIMGPDNCHLSVVDHASTDATKVMLRMLKEFLDLYNRGDIQLSNSTPSLSSSSMEAVEKRAVEETERVERGVRGQDQDKKHKAKKDKKQKKQYLSYTITTMTARDASAENVARIKDLALDPLLAAASTSEVVVSGGSDKSGAKGEGEEDEGVAFDRIILMDPAVTCAEDLLELVFQSLLQDADVTCGMDLGYYSTADAGETVGAEADVTATDPDKLQDGVYDSTVTRDMLHQKLHRSSPSSSSSAQTNKQISNDPLTQTRFSKRVPFQVESCWSRAVVLKAASALRVSGVPSGKPVLFAEVVEKQTREEIVEVKEGEGEQCATTHTVQDERNMFSNALWSTTAPSTESSGTETSSPAADTTNIVKMVVVPSIQFTTSPKEYALQGRFDSWGLWPKTEKQYRNELETRLIAASHRPLYGYRPSTSSYGYTPRVEEEDSAGGVAGLLDVVFSGLHGQADKGTTEEQDGEQDHNQEQKDREEQERKEEEERMVSAIVPEETVEGLRVRLEAVGAVFGVQDIQNAVLAKRDSDLILDWRPRFAMANAPPGSVDC